MARTCGIRIGRTDFELLVLDGSVKKPSVSYCVRGEIPDDSEDPLGDVIAELKSAVKGQKIPLEEIGLVVDAGSAAFRTLTLPFDDPAKIEQVIKFEIEAKLPQWDIDDVIIDFHTMNSTGVESHLLVTAIPKEPLGDIIEAITKAGFEPFEAEVETSALVNAAWSAGVLSPEGAQVLVHIGKDSAAMVVVDGGVPRNMRAARLSGSDDAARVRLLREITRTVTGLQAANPLDGIYLTGQTIEGLSGEEIEDIEISYLQPFDEAVAPEGSTPSHFAVVFGAAIGRMGGGLISPRLRREELAFTGKMERLELPLAVLALLAASVMGIYFVILQKEIAPLESDLHRWLNDSAVAMIGSPNSDAPYRITSPSETLVKQVNRLLNDDSPEANDYNAMLALERSLDSEIKLLQKRLGKDSEIRQPQSAFGAMTRVLGVLDKLGDDVGFFAIKNIDASFRPGRTNTKDMVDVSIDMVFFAESDVVAGNYWQNFYLAVKDMPWCIEFEEPGTDSLEGSSGLLIDGIKIKVDMAVLEGGGEEA
jgi:hypothetical protein